MLPVTSALPLTFSTLAMTSAKESIHIMIRDKSHLIHAEAGAQLYERATNAGVSPAFFQRLQRHLFSSRQILQRLSHSFPSTGIDALGHGQRLAVVVDRLLLWEAILLGEQEPLDALAEATLHELDGATWTRIQQRWPAALARLSVKEDTWAHYPMRLRAFCDRHSALQTPTYGDFAHNDLEMELLWAPAYSLQEVLEHALWRWQAAQPEPPAKTGWQRWRRWFFWIVAALALGAYQWGGAYRRPLAPPAGPPPGAVAGGIQGAYFQGTQFQKLQQRRTDPDIWFHWHAAPIANVAANYFSIRWAGYLRAPRPGRYKFCLHHDDGASLSINQRSLVRQWRSGGAPVHCGFTELATGWHRMIVQMYDRYGPAIARLSWQPPGTPHPKKIPAQHLCCRNL